MIHGVDLFCGAGGSTTGLMMACEELGNELDVLAINHWNIAIATHMTNYPGFRHMCETLDSVNPRTAIPDGKLDILLAGPECTHHSNARGGKPMLDQSRASAWHVVRWCEALYVEDVIVENVTEFMKWGPLNKKGKRIKEREGETFKAWIAALESLDYRVECKVLNAADYGDATTRKRLFIRARRGKRSIVWPVPTNDTKSWRPARDVIDWDLPGQSIFERKKPLAKATMARIESGLKKFGGDKIEPFLIVFRNNQGAHSINQPLPTMTTSGANFGLCEPFILQMDHGNDIRNHSLKNPMPTITSADAWGLVEPFLVEYRGNHRGKADGVVLDIRFRMLQPHELSKAMGFPDKYKFAGTREAKVRQIGNAWSVRTAKALCKATLQ